METIDEYNVVCEGVSLKNDWRKTTTGIMKGRNSTGTMKNAAIEFIIEGDDEEDLAEKIRITEREFNKENARVYGFRTVDGTDGVNRIFDYHLGDGESVGVYCNVSEMNEAHTRFSRYMMLEVYCDLTVKLPSGVSAPGAPEADIDGLLEPMEIVEVYETGNWQTKSISGKFTYSVEDDSLGPWTIDAIAEKSGGDHDGKAEIQLAATPSGLAVDDAVFINNTTFYNGRHRVVDITGDNVTIDTEHTQDETLGSPASITGGEVETAKEKYDAAYSTLKALIDVSASESKDITLVHKVEQQLNDGTFEFTLTSQEQEFIPGGKGDGDTQLVRTVQMKVNKAQVKEWEQSSDLSFARPSTTPPKIIEAAGLVMLNKEAITDSLEEHWENDVKSDVIARIETHLNLAAGEFDEATVQVTFNGTNPAIAFIITGYEDFDTVLSVELVKTTQTPHEAMVYSKGSGLHGLQTPDVEDVPVITRQLTRVGKTEVDLSQLTAPTESGYTFHLHDEVETVRGPLDIEGLGTDLYLQTRTEVYLKLKLS